MKVFDAAAIFFPLIISIFGTAFFTHLIRKWLCTKMQIFDVFVSMQSYCVGYKVNEMVHNMTLVGLSSAWFASAQLNQLSCKTLTWDSTTIEQRASMCCLKRQHNSNSVDEIEWVSAYTKLQMKSHSNESAWHSFFYWEQRRVQIFLFRTRFLFALEQIVHVEYRNKGK